LKQKVVPTLKPVEKKERKTFLNRSEETQVRKINGHEINTS